MGPPDKPGDDEFNKIAVAPLPTASSIKLLPSAFTPGSAANKNPGRTARLSAVNPSITGLTEPL
jgi:hypothetical protein